VSNDAAFPQILTQVLEDVHISKPPKAAYFQDQKISKRQGQVPDRVPPDETMITFLQHRLSRRNEGDCTTSQNTHVQYEEKSIHLNPEDFGDLLTAK
jgi:hypothetical protein